MSAIYHLVTEPELWAGLGADGYRPARFSEDGFVHCCTDRDSSLAVARDYFARATEPVLALELARAPLGAALVFEAPAPIPGAATAHLATAQLFPHVYGPLPHAALRGGAQLERSGDGFLWPKRFAPLGELLAESLAARLRAGEARGVPALRALRRGCSRALRGAPPGLVIRLATALLANGGRGARLVSSELVRHHPAALAALTPRDVRRLAGRLASWDDVDIFACMIAGQAYREGALGDAELARWARSKDRWWRRAALVSTVPLNVKAQGGKGDPRRTLRVCRPLVADRDDMVVQALSWALRALAERDPAAVRRFVAAERARLAPRVLREVGQAAHRPQEPARPDAGGAMSESSREGGCLCGAIRYRADGAGTDATLCHCGTCRRAAGAPAVAWVTFPLARFAFTRGEPSRFRSSTQVERTFCARCGTPLTYAHQAAPDAVDVTTGSLDDPAEFPPRDHTWTSHALPWMDDLAGLPRFERRVVRAGGRVGVRATRARAQLPRTPCGVRRDPRR
jgi:3-methyladenine DNA glycosylase AlkD/uncharacterized protein (DUF952 family)